MKKLLLLLILINCCACNKAPKDFINATITDTQNKPTSIAVLANNKLTVIYFLGTDCPISQQYSLTLKNLAQTYKEVQMIAVVPGPLTDGIISYKQTYNLPFQIYADSYYQLTKAINATVTPECFLISGNTVIYSGKIDDFAVAPGITRQRVQQHFLADALDAALSQKQIEVTYTKPAGCFIEVPNE
ncbi:MAG: redoxin domain-containing protein [Bacteroidia bacterium]|nr:redoxin domain-containing protein [Bacteroidia bacterium]